VRPVSADLRFGKESCMSSQLEATERGAYEHAAVAFYHAIIARGVRA